MGIPHADGNFITDRVIAAEEFYDFSPRERLTRGLEQFRISLISRPAF